jgi:hypothetical protein
MKNKLCTTKTFQFFIFLFLLISPSVYTYYTAYQMMQSSTNNPYKNVPESQIKISPGIPDSFSQNRNKWCHKYLKQVGVYICILTAVVFVLKMPIYS